MIQKMRGGFSSCAVFFGRGEFGRDELECVEVVFVGACGICYAQEMLTGTHTRTSQ
jgi:hypothetical protein